MFGWRRTVVARTSRRKRSASSRSAPISGRRSFTATDRPSAHVRGAVDGGHAAPPDDRDQPVAVRRDERRFGRCGVRAVVLGHARTIPRPARGAWRRPVGLRDRSGAGGRAQQRAPRIEAVAQREDRAVARVLAGPRRVVRRPRPGVRRRRRERPSPKSTSATPAPSVPGSQAATTASAVGRIPSSMTGPAGDDDHDQPVDQRPDRGDRRRGRPRAAPGSPSRPGPRRTAVRRRPRYRSSRASRPGSRGRRARRGRSPSRARERVGDRRAGRDRARPIPAT